MEIKNSKMTWTTFLLVITIFILLSIREIIKKQKEMDGIIVSILKALTVEKTDREVDKKAIGALFDQSNLLIAQFRKMYLIIDLLKLYTPPSINNTIVGILKSDEPPTTREASVLLLKNLLQEYNEVVSILTEKMQGLEDGEEKEKLEAMITEYQNTMSVISTISEDSSDEYIQQIYNEVAYSMKKVRSLLI